MFSKRTVTIRGGEPPRPPRYQENRCLGQRFFLLSMPLVLALFIGGCATFGQPLPPPPTTAEIVQMAKDGVPADDIIKRIHEAQAVYRLPASELAKLREQGVPDKVVDYMQQTYIADERWREHLRSRDFYMWYGWPYYYRGYWGYGSPFWGPPFW